MSQKIHSCVAIIGVGLIGGSFALALRAAGQVDCVIGCGRSEANLRQGRQLGVIDRWTTNPAAAVAEADLVLLATPVGGLPDIFAQIAPHLRADAVVTDAGSTKQDVLVAAQALGERADRFVPGHPIAGAEFSGVAAARADLFQGKKVVLTPPSHLAESVVGRVAAAWQACGAEVRRMSATDHDRVFAAVSHLPHLLAFGLVHELAERDDANLFFDFAASGFRDFTRIASSHAEMWRDICLANRAALLAELDHYRTALDSLASLLQQRDGDRLQQVFEQARAARNAWIAAHPALASAPVRDVLQDGPPGE